MRSLILALIIITCTFASAHATTYTFTPSPVDLSDLAHQYYYTWGITWSIPAGEKITEATLTYYNIYDWTRETNDRLYTHLLDNPLTGSRSYWDNEGGGDNFSGQGYLVGNWTDPNGGSPTNFNLTYTFSSLGLIDELTLFANTPYNATRANFGFGIDPDCHYYNANVTFSITTAPIPEPASLSLFGLGVLGLLTLGRGKKREEK
ncbi:MAG: PEP-CTERM sorting domain-containing protein [Candidatus Omnitrophota bacterium]